MYLSLKSMSNTVAALYVYRYNAKNVCHLILLDYQTNYLDNNTWQISMEGYYEV